MKTKEDQYSILNYTARIKNLKENMINEPRFMSLEQARIITKCYKENDKDSKALKRAKSLNASLSQITIKIDPPELIVGNRTPGVRSGVVFPEAGSSWINTEIETLPTRPQDRFNVKKEDIKEIKEEIYPYWQDKCLEDIIKNKIGDEISDIVKVAKINQKDHAQGHICPNTEKWLRLGPAGLKEEAEKKLQSAVEDQRDFYESVIIVQDGSITFIKRYARLARELAENPDNLKNRTGLLEVSRICSKLAEKPPETFHEALQSLWFLYVILQMESNASSFSPGRADQ